MIRWQKRRGRSGWGAVRTGLVLVCGLLGAAGVAMQVSGAVDLDGPAALAPGLMLAAAAGVSLFGGARAALAWLAG